MGSLVRLLVLGRFGPARFSVPATMLAERRAPPLSGRST